MSLDGQLEKLSALYAEKSDGELLDLHEQRDGLTELAQQALAGVMRERGLAARGVPGESGGQSSPGEVGNDTGEDALVENEVLAYMFHEAFQAREAIRTMKEAGIPHRMLDWHSVEPEREASYTGVDLGLVVRQQDTRRTMVVLKEKLGLFPEAEEVSEEGPRHEDAFTVLSMFDRKEALVAAQALGGAGITYVWRDGHDDHDEASELPDEETIAIEVRPAHLDRATKVVEDALAGLRRMRATASGARDVAARETFPQRL